MLEPIVSSSEKMVWQNLKPDVFDVKLAVARLVDHDDRYQLENAAKFRAVNQQGTGYQKQSFVRLV